MARQKVVNYIRDLLQKGYDISTIKNTMLKYGYSNNEIDDAIKDIHHPIIRHEIHLPRTTIFVIVFTVLTISGVVFFFLYNQEKSTEQLLDLNLEPVKTTVAAGDSISFLKEISNLGSQKRYDIFIRQEVLDQKTSKIITQKSETRAIETSGSTKTSIEIPKETKAGNYLLKVIVEYHGKSATATLPIKIVSSGSIAGKETCFDGIKNQDEEGIDCGGACKPCGGLDCNDNNPCTDDKTEDTVCVHNPIIPCCGNGICEEKESCAVDCKEVSHETLDEIKEIAKSNPVEALQKCNQVDVPDLKDTCIKNIGEVQNDKDYCGKIESQKIKDQCYSSIAKSSNDSSICEVISNDGIRDSCYSYFFVPPNKDYTVCLKLTNKDLQQSCDRLRQLFELSQKT